MDLSLVVVVATVAAVCAGIIFTVRAFKASEAPARTAQGDGQQPAEVAGGVTSPHDQATIELLKRFFDGKECAICKRPIPPVHRGGLKPGLLNPATHETYSWDQIPHANLSEALKTHLPLCSACEVAESFRRRFPNLAVDRDRSDTQPPDRVRASS